MERQRRNVVPEHPNVKPIGLGVDLIRSMATSHSDAIAAMLELIDNAHDM